MKEIISITELAKIRNVTTETLRHYDRIGLLKPKTIDDKGGMRYYSIYQYEKLGTIRELQQLGMSLQEIKEYFQNRDIKKTHELLLRINKNINFQIIELNRLNKSVETKISYIEDLLLTAYNDSITEKSVDPHYFLSSNQIVHNEIELSYQAIELENKIKQYEKIAPIFATNRYAGIISIDSLLSKCYDTELAISIDKELACEIKMPITKIKGGDYVCACYVGSFWDRKPTIEKLLNYIQENSYVLIGSVIQLEWYDYTITNNENNIIYEIQMPVKKKRNVSEDSTL